MDAVPFTSYIEHCIGAFAKTILPALAVPLLPVIILNLFLSETPALMPRTLAIEKRAASIGIGHGLNCPYVPVTLICIAIGLTLFLFDIIDAPADYSGQGII
jgi:hypothetical protein